MTTTLLTTIPSKTEICDQRFAIQQSWTETERHERRVVAQQLQKRLYNAMFGSIIHFDKAAS